MSYTLLVVNGVPGDYYGREILTKDIYSVGLLKGPDAMALYGPKGRYGAIIFTTKKGMKLDTAALRAGPWSGGRQGKVVLPAAAPAQGSPGGGPVDLQRALYYVDGVETPVEAVRRIPPGDLVHTSILKVQQAGGEYGDKGKYGVVFVRTRKFMGPNGLLISERTDTVQTYVPKVAVESMDRLKDIYNVDGVEPPH